VSRGDGSDARRWPDDARQLVLSAEGAEGRQGEDAVHPEEDDADGPVGSHAGWVRQPQERAPAPIIKTVMKSPYKAPEPVESL
jgi:hypothetical protein